MFVVWISMAFAEEACVDRFAVSQQLEVAGDRLTLDHGVLTLEGLELGHRVVEAPAVAGDRVAFIEQRDSDGLYDLYLYDGKTGALTRRLEAQTPKQLAFSPDGEFLAYVDGVTSISSVFVLRFSGGEPVQLTNVGLVRFPGQAPEGFVPSPSNGLWIQGDRVVWDGPDTNHSVTFGGAL